MQLTAINFVVSCVLSRLIQLTYLLRNWVHVAEFFLEVASGSATQEFPNILRKSNFNFVT
jgi:hypothetical protein